MLNICPTYFIYTQYHTSSIIAILIWYNNEQFWFWNAYICIMHCTQYRCVVDDKNIWITKKINKYKSIQPFLNNVKNEIENYFFSGFCRNTPKGLQATTTCALQHNKSPQKFHHGSAVHVYTYYDLYILLLLLYFFLKASNTRTNK